MLSSQSQCPLAGSPIQPYARAQFLIPKRTFDHFVRRWSVPGRAQPINTHARSTHAFGALCAGIRKSLWAHDAACGATIAHTNDMGLYTYGWLIN